MNDAGDWKPQRRTQRLEDILAHGLAVSASLSKLTKSKFAKSETIYKAACYDVLCISDAVARLIAIDPEIAERHTQIPWRQVADMGNVIRHEYGRVDVNLIWETVRGSDLRDLLKVVESELGRSK